MALEQHLSNDEFFTHLTAMLASTHALSHGSVYLTQKALPPSNDQSPKDGAILVRASNGLSRPNRAQKLKYSTLVQTGDAPAFYVRYAEVCKKGMEGLRKRDRKAKGKKSKAKKKKEAKPTTTIAG